MIQLTRRKISQRDRLLALLRRHAPDWVPLPGILALGIAQYSARIFELRRLGHRIESKQEGSHSWFRLITGNAQIPTSVTIDQKREQTETAVADETLFGDLQPEPRYPD
jgi:hypothetical protein